MPAAKNRRPLKATSRFPAKKWEKKYAAAVEPKLRSFNKALLDALDDKGVIEKFSAYLLKEYELEATDKRQVDKLAFKVTKDLKKLAQLAKGVISAASLDLEKVVDSMTGEIYKASSGHAFSKLGVEAIWNIDTPQFKDALAERVNLIKDTKDSAAQAVLTKLRDGVYDNGGHPLSRDNLDSIKVLLNDASEDRARTIARTETKNVQGSAARTVFKENGVNGKTWIYSGSGYDRHKDMDGETVGIDEAFSNGAQYPGDGPAGEAVNCMCDFAPKFDADLIDTVREKPVTGYDD